MTEVFVDTSFWIAYLDRHDRCHELASASFPTFLVSCHLVTTNFIVHETLTYLNCSLKVHAQAMTFLETVRQAVNEECLMVLRIDADREERAMDLLTHNSDKDFSVVDWIWSHCLIQHFIFTGHPLLWLKHCDWSLRARERITAHFRLPSSGHLEPIFPRKILNVGFAMPAVLLLQIGSI